MGQMETRKLTKLYCSYTKQGLIDLVEKLEDGVSGWKQLLVSTGLGALGLISPVTGGLFFVAGTTYGVLAALPRNRDRIAKKLQKFINTMNNSDNAVIEFELEFVYATMADLKADKPSDIYLEDLLSTVNTGTQLYDYAKLEDYVNL
jgi:hypothetical protein